MDEQDEGRTFDGTFESITIHNRTMDADEIKARNQSDTEGWYEAPSGDLVHIVAHDGRVWVNGQELDRVENPHAHPSQTE